MYFLSKEAKLMEGTGLPECLTLIIGAVGGDGRWYMHSKTMALLNYNILLLRI